MAKRGRRTRVEGTEDQERARDAGRQRIVYRVSGSWVVAMPLWARQALSVVEGGAIYWHDAGQGAVLLSASPARPTAQRSVTNMQRQLDEARRTNEKLRKQVGALPLKTLHRGQNAGYMMALKHYARLDGDVQAVAEKLDQLVGLLGGTVRPRRRAARKPSPSASPPSPDSSAGEAVTPGEHPPGDPQSSDEADRAPRL